MSNNVDRRIVEMEFDNKDFENNVQTSVKSLDKLKKSLNLEESAKGLSALENAGHKFSLDGMVQAAEAVTSKFSVMGTIGDQVLRRIGDAAYNALNKMKGFVDSLTIEPISTGMQEYETQINAIQTILSNTRDKMTKQGLSDAERLEIVNDRLDQLNHYADKTIYNFTEMTRNIGTFTAAGVELDTAVQSIQGIANLAAVSGSTSEQASRAMYQLSQAISTGTVKLMDWNSVVNAGMGGEVFQKALIRTATAMGKTVDVTVTETNKAGKKVKKTVKRTVEELIAEEGSFRESLSKGWLTSDVLTATLEQFSWDFEQMAKDMGYTAANMEEGVLKAMEMKKGELLAQGYTVEEAEEIIQLAKDATEAATKVKTFTQLFDTLKEAAQSGWTQTWEYIIGDFEEAKEMLTGISDFFGKIIDSSAEARNKIVKEWHDAGGRDMLWNNDETKGPLGTFWNLTYGIKNMIGMIRGEFQKIFPPTTSQTLLNITQRIQQATANFKAWTENSDGMDKIRRIVAGLAAALGIAKTAIGYVWQGFQKLTGFGEPAASGILEFAAGIGDWLVKAKESIETSEEFQKFLQKISGVIASVRGVIVGALKTVFTWIGKLGGKIKSSGILTQIGHGISDFVGKIPDAIAKVEDWIKSIAEYIKTSDALSKAWGNVKKFFEPMLKGLGDFGERLKEAISKFLDKDVSGEESLWARLKARFAAFGSAFSDVFGTVKAAAANAWDKIKDFLSTFFTKTIPDFFNSRKLDASSILEKAKAIDWGKILKTVLGTATIVELLKAVRNFSKIGKIAKSFENLTQTVKDIAKNGASLTKDGLFINGKNKSPIADTLLKVAASIGVLVASVYVLAKMDSKGVVKGLGLLTLLATELLVISALFNKMDFDGGSVLKAAAAILLLVIPIKLLSAMKTADALNGILAVGLILAELALFSRMMGKDFNGKQAGFIGLGIAVNLLVGAIKSLSKLNVGNMAKGLIGMEVLLLEMASFTKKVSGKKVAGMIGLAIGINLMVSAVKRMGKLDTKTIVKGVLGLGGLMTAFGAMLKMSNGVNLGSALVLLLTMAGSLIIFMEAFRQIEGSNTEDMLKFSVSFAAMMTSMSIAMKVLSSIPITGALKGVANMAILVVGLGALVVGLGYLQSQWQGMTDFLEGGGNVLGQIGRAIGKFVGGIGGGIVEGMNLPQLGSDLSAFMENSKGFIEGAKTVDTSAASGVGNLTAAIIKIAGAEFVSALVSLFAGENPVTKFSNDLVTLGNGLSAYGTSVLPLASVPDTVLDRSIAVAGALADVAGKIPATGSVMSLLNGVGDMGTFGKNITSLGNGLASFALQISAIDDEQFSQSKIDMLVSVANGLATLETNLEGQGGLQDVFVGIQSLSTFSEGFEPFATGLNTFISEVQAIEYDSEQDSEKMTAIIAIAASLAELETKLEGKHGLKNAINGVKDLSDFGGELEPFGEGLNGFLTQARMIVYNDDDQTKIEHLVAVADALSQLETSLEAQGGLADKIEGVKSLVSFAREMGPFADGLNGFITEVSNLKDEDYNQNKIDAALGAAEAINTFQKTLPNTDGWWQSVIGTQDLGQFAANVKMIGESLASFAGNIGSVDMGDTENALSVLGVIQTFTDELGKTDGLWNKIDQFFGGSSENTLLGTANNMRLVGENLNSFATNVSGLKADKLDNLTEMYQNFEEFINSLSSSGDVFSNLAAWAGGSSEKTLISIANDMGIVGSNLALFSDGIATVDASQAKFEQFKTLFASFSEIVKEVIGEEDLWYNSYTLSTVFQSFGDLGSHLHSFYEGLGDLNAERLATAASALNTIVSLVSNASGIDPANVGTISEILKQLGQTEFSESGEVLGNAFVVSMAEAIQNGTVSVQTSATELGTSGAKGAQTTYSIWYATGQNLSKGLGSGISSMAAVVRRSAVNVAAGAIRSIQMTWAVHSPSKVGTDLGMYFDLGIAGGLDAYSKVVSDRAANVGESAVQSAATMLHGVDGSIFDNIDPNPTIRPVMDLSSIQAGIGTMNGMFRSDVAPIGLFRGMNFAKGVDALNFDGARISGGMTDKNIIAKLDTLQTRMEELGEAVSNMKIVLDSGELIGATSRKIDDSLGTLEMRKGRGN